MTTLKRLRDLFSRRYLTKRSLDVRYALVEACIIGLFSAFAALLLNKGIGWLGGWRIQAANAFGNPIALPLVGLVLGVLAGLLVEQLSPQAGGGGIPQVKAVLARFPMPMSLRVAVVKTLGTILVLGSGLTLGRRGPTVHIGAALAAQLSQWLPTSPEHRRQIIAAGAAAGLAAGFNTPIAGVLFVVEELMRDVSGLTLETAILASFVGSVVSRRVLGATDDLNLSVSLLDDTVVRGFAAQEIPFYILLGILAGILGGLFNRGLLLSLAVNRRISLSMPWRVGLAGLISGAVVAFLPPIFRDNAGLREFLMASEGDWQITAIAFVVHFLLTLLAYGTGAPGGLFAPALVLGSALGFLVGNAQEFFLGIGSPNTYALTGMGAFFTAVARVPVTAIVIVFELTTDFNLVLPLMIGSAIAYVVAESVSKGSIYEHLLEASGIHLEETPNANFLTRLTAADVMTSQIETLASDLTLDEVLQAISRSQHRGFPVVEDGRLIGIIAQEDLAQLTKRPREAVLKEIIESPPVTVRSTTSLSEVLYLLSRYKLAHLPVTEGERLLGLITYKDIIRAEAKQLCGDSYTHSVSVAAPSYVVYQTRSPMTGKGRILLPLANPKTAVPLLKIAVAIARAQKYEIECLQIIQVPKYRSPSQARVETFPSRRLMRRVEKLARLWKVPIHTQIRVAQDTAEAILDTISDRRIDMTLMGWEGSTSTQGAIFGNVVDTLIRQAPCELVLVKLGKPPHNYSPNSKQQTTWLLPIAGGPNAQRAIQLLPALSVPYRRSDAAKIILCQVYSPQSEPNTEVLEKTASALHNQTKVAVVPVHVRAHSVSDAIISLALTENCDLVMLGASQEKLLQQVIHGNIPRAIAKGVKSTVILVRGAIE